MKPLTRRIAVVLAAAVSWTGCGPPTGSTEATDDEAAAGAPDTVDEAAPGAPSAGEGGAPRHGEPVAPADSLLSAGALQPYRYTVLDSARFDVLGDEAPERIEVLATVERTAAGVLLWEDGHHWAVVVRDDSLSYPLVERFLPWGRAEFIALREEPGGAPAVIVTTRAGAGCVGGEGDLELRVETFVYDGEAGGFRRRALLESSGAGVCRGSQSRGR